MTTPDEVYATAARALWAAVDAAHAAGYQRAIDALRGEADRLNPSTGTATTADGRNLTMWAVYAAAADRLAALAEGPQP